jgi:hypothetical protein
VGAPLADEVSRSGGVERFLQARTEGSASAGRDGRERVGEVEPTR